MPEQMKINECPPPPPLKKKKNNNNNNKNCLFVGGVQMSNEMAQLSYCLASHTLCEEWAWKSIR